MYSAVELCFCKGFTEKCQQSSFPLKLKLVLLQLLTFSCNCFLKKKNNCDEFITILKRWLIIYMVNEIWLLTKGNENADFVPIPTIFIHSVLYFIPH